MKVSGGISLLAMVALGYHAGQAQCVLPPAAQWRKVDLLTNLDHPVSMSVMKDGRVFIAEMWSGKVKLFTPATGVTTLATLPIYKDNAAVGINGKGVENGLLGVAADPDFATTHWLYVFYSKKLPGENYPFGDADNSPHQHVLARFTVSDGALTKEKVLLTFKRQSARHAGGGMAINSRNGELFLSTGDDTYPIGISASYGPRSTAEIQYDALRSAANSNDLRGKVLRIKPIPFPDGETPAEGVGKTYAIPAGNMFPPGTDLTRPEIYTMGHRNPYRVKVDTASGTVFIGEVGPDSETDDVKRGPRGHDEFNLAAKPGYFGWPLANADNIPYIGTAEDPYPDGVAFDVNKLQNLSARNTGLKDLPPAQPAFGFYNAGGSQTGPSAGFGTGAETAIGGPLYRYDAKSASTVKFPPYFDGKLIGGDWSRQKIWVMEMDADKKLKKVEILRSSFKLVDLDMGPNGELYVLEYGGSGGGYHGPVGTGKLYKVEYTGAQYDASVCAQYRIPTALAPDLSGAARSRGVIASFKTMAGRDLSAPLAVPAGAARISVYDLKGGLVHQGAVSGRDFRLPAKAAGSGVLYVEFFR